MTTRCFWSSDPASIFDCALIMLSLRVVTELNMALRSREVRGSIGTKSSTNDTSTDPVPLVSNLLSSRSHSLSSSPIACNVRARVPRVQSWRVTRLSPRKSKSDNNDTHSDRSYSCEVGARKTSTQGRATISCQHEGSIVGSRKVAEGGLFRVSEYDARARAGAP